MSRRLLGNFSTENLIRVLNFTPGLKQSLILFRGGRPGPTKGPPPQHNFTTMSALLSDSTTMEESKATTKCQVNGS
ncbi:hypothetical protein QN277_009294 [Acacia crassicarpa]|uniref:Uncharacterized protein n=1 Tax=Acacia crassicarpa TaxID=499986 RepID=A0AAE1ITI3_9FABA|nr:hypothetical protein QN277_009294 [Acacia crassicarpa]